MIMDKLIVELAVGVRKYVSAHRNPRLDGPPSLCANAL
jgi:hypothetical protein